MSDYIVISRPGMSWYAIVRTSDWVVIARCDDSSYASQVAAALNA